MPSPRNAVGRAEAYLICATPRTGSSLLCGLLESTAVAGHPESYFRQPDQQSWAEHWGIVNSFDGTFDRADYLRAALAEGSTRNGVFAARLMWGTLEELVAALESVFPGVGDSDMALLNQAFGRTRFIYLQRGDVLAQAVSWLRAEQTTVWFETDQSGRKQPEQPPDFDFERIHELVRLINEHNAAWQRWFVSARVRPYPVRYEDLDADPVGVTRGILDFLGLHLPHRREILVRHRRLADELNAQWIGRYRAEAKKRGIPA